MSRDFQSIPIIDISGLYSRKIEDRLAVADQIEQVARNVGFFYVSGHPVPPNARSALEDAAKRFFEQPLADKMNSYIGKSVNHSGYVPEGEEILAGGKFDKKEAYDIGLDYAGEPKGGMLGPNQWPYLPGFKAQVTGYYRHVEALAKVLFRGFALSMGLEEEFFETRRTAPPCQLRMIHYPHDAEAVDVQGMGAHTDYEYFTILYSTAPGLEVLNSAGEWIDAPPVPGCFIVNIGDMIETMTNGEFVATSHRVRKVSDERYSFPFFATGDYETVVEPLPRFVSAQKPPAYSRLVSGEHLFAQTAQTFGYLKKKVAEGKLVLPKSALPLSAYGQEARTRDKAAP